MDAINFHFYETPDALTIITDFMAGQMASNWGYSKPILSHEIGQLPGLYPSYDDVGYARDAFKTLVIGQTITQTTGYAPGLLADFWFSIDIVAVALWDSQGNPRPVADAYSLVVHAIGNQYTFDGAQAAGPNLFHYVFADREGTPGLEFVWTETAPEQVTLHPPIGKTQALVTDYLNLSPQIYSGTFTLTVSPDTPLQVQWQP